MGIIKRDGWLWNFFSRALNLNSFYAGELFLSYGKNLVTIPTEKKPKKVWISVDDSETSIPVCCGDVNLVAVKLLKDGFVLSANIKSNVCNLQWFMEY